MDYAKLESETSLTKIDQGEGKASCQNNFIKPYVLQLEYRYDEQTAN
jgi:hypothetical protein